MAFSVVYGNKKKRQEGIEKEATVYFVSYDNLSWINENQLGKFSNLVIDHLSVYKNEKTKRSQTMMAAREYADRIIGITSFPAQNQLSDLHGELKMVDGGKRLGQSKAGFFERYYCYMKAGLSFAPDGAEVQESSDVIRLMQMSNGTICNEQGKTLIFHSKTLDVVKKIMTETEGNILVAYWFVHDRDIISEKFPEARATKIAKKQLGWSVTSLHEKDMLWQNLWGCPNIVSKYIAK